MKTARIEEKFYSFIGDTGVVSPRELVACFRVDESRAEAWLRRRASAGYLFESEGRYQTSCPIGV